MACKLSTSPPPYGTIKGPVRGTADLSVFLSVPTPARRFQDQAISRAHAATVYSRELDTLTVGAFYPLPSRRSKLPPL